MVYYRKTTLLKEGCTMKKLIALLLALLLALPALAMGEDPLVLRNYTSDFIEGTDGWYARSGDGAAAVSVANGRLNITGRTAAWNSPGRDFALLNGKKYKLSVQVMQSAAESVDFMLSVAHTKDGVETYENLGKVSAPKNNWATITAEYTAGDFDKYVLYIETVGHDNIDFTMQRFSLTMTELYYDMTLPSLAEAYSSYFDVGVALSRSPLQDAKRMAFVASQFNIITHENELKPDAVIDVFGSKKLAEDDETEVAIKFTAAKPLLDFCQANGIKVHGHVLVWHNQTPAAFFHEGYDTAKPFVSREVMLGRLENYIRKVFEYAEANYPGLIVSWDVVNEAVSDNSVNLRKSNWTNVIGEDFVNRAFEFARKHAPEGVKLYYNDYSTPYEPKLTGICNLLDSLIAEGTIDGYGFQCHYSTNTPMPFQVRRAFERIAAKGLRLRVSELDIGITGNSDLNLKSQAKLYADLFRIYMDFADQLDAVQVWGLTDERSWRNGEYPLLFDSKVAPKPAFYALLDLVKPGN